MSHHSILMKMNAKLSIVIFLVFSLMCLSVMAQEGGESSGGEANPGGSAGGESGGSSGGESGGSSGGESGGSSGGESGGSGGPASSSASVLSNIFVDLLYIFRGFLF